MASDTRNRARLSTLAVVLSAAMHLVTFVALGAVHVGSPAPRTANEVEVSVVTEPAPPNEPATPPAEPEEPPVPEPPPEVKAPPPVKVARVPKTTPPPAKPPAPVEEAPTPKPAAEETIADFSGTTLTAEGAGWVSAAGNNAAMDAPIGKANAIVTGRNVKGVQGGEVGGTGLRIVSESDLSRRPEPPNGDLLNAALERAYPKSARQQGIEGVARIKVRVMASGKLQPLATINETYPGFAEACKTSLRNMSWRPGLDRVGQPVATDIQYKCVFTIE